jgi:hypothetical protein
MPPVSDATRKKISIALSGENHPNYGKRCSEETKEKMSNSLKGKPSPFKGKKHSEETRKLISEKCRLAKQKL